MAIETHNIKKPRPDSPGGSQFEPLGSKKGADQGFLLPNGSNCEPPGDSGRGFLMS